MKTLALSLLILSILRVSLSQEQNLQFLPSTGRAKCIDGSQPGFYFTPGQNSGADKFFIFLEGGGRCDGSTIDEFLNSCYRRSNSQLGSSTKWADSYSFGDFILKQENNPVMYNWNQIFVKYCDGNLYQGSSEPLQYKDKLLYFRGYDIITELFAFLLSDFGMGQAKTVVLSGGSAGGLGAFYWNKYLRELLPNNIKVLAAPDSGYFPIVNPNAELQAEVLDLITNNNRHLIQPTGCPYIHDNRNAYKCGSAEYILDLMAVPLFIINSLYDEYSLVNILGVNCVTDSHSLSNCNQNDIKQVQWLRKQTLSFLNKVKQQKPDWGVWAISCLLHVFFAEERTYSGQSYSVPQRHGITVSYSLSQFILAHTSSSSSEEQKIDIPFSIDHALYPLNIPCNGYNSQSQYII